MDDDNKRTQTIPFRLHQHHINPTARLPVPSLIIRILVAARPWNLVHFDLVHLDHTLARFHLSRLRLTSGSALLRTTCRRPILTLPTSWGTPSGSQLFRLLPLRLFEWIHKWEAKQLYSTFNRIIVTIPK